MHPSAQHGPLAGGKPGVHPMADVELESEGQTFVADRATGANDGGPGCSRRAPPRRGRTRPPAGPCRPPWPSSRRSPSHCHETDLRQGRRLRWCVPTAVSVAPAIGRRVAEHDRRLLVRVRRGVEHHAGAEPGGVELVAEAEPDSAAVRGIARQIDADSPCRCGAGRRPPTPVGHRSQGRSSPIPGRRFGDRPQNSHLDRCSPSEPRRRPRRRSWRTGDTPVG